MKSVLQIIKEITEEKRAHKIAPDHAMHLEIAARYGGSNKEMDKELAGLVKKRAVIQHRTLNGKAYLVNIRTPFSNQ